MYENHLTWSVRGLCRDSHSCRAADTSLPSVTRAASAKEFVTAMLAACPKLGGIACAHSDSKGLKKTGRDCSPLRFGPTATSDEQSPEDSSLQVIDKTDERWWARKDSNLRPMDYESTVVVSKTLKTSINTAVLRIPALRLLYLTGIEWHGVRYILGTVGTHPKWPSFIYIYIQSVQRRDLGGFQINLPLKVYLLILQYTAIQA